MSNAEIIDQLQLLARLMELHGENPFKSKAVSNAAFKLNKLRYDFQGKGKEEIEQIEGIGKGISGKIIDLIENGHTKELDELLEKTPPGLLEVLEIKGLGPKKVKHLWDELGIESSGELLYACNENRLAGLKGFGEKTQQQVKENLEFLRSNQNKVHYAAIEAEAQALLKTIGAKEPGMKLALTGEVARKCEIIERLGILFESQPAHDHTKLFSSMPIPVVWHVAGEEDFYRCSIQYSSAPEHLKQIGFESLPKKHFQNEEEVYKALKLPFIPPELREGLTEVDLARRGALPELIRQEDIRGILHCHSTYSDGLHSLKEMAEECKSRGYAYFGICDHSRSAGYAGGLSIERVIEQQEEIDQLNKSMAPFRILKGIESDILGNGDLDYPEEVLKRFDFVVASVHSNLKMDIERATSRLIKAIENPYTRILGHPTGRLLLARPGYPIHHKKVIDACAANGVSIELNAHPYRLDIDWRWIPYCTEKGVMLSINPDAHHKEGIGDVYYGLCVARKGMLTKENCLNALELDAILGKFNS